MVVVLLLLLLVVVLLLLVVVLLLVNLVVLLLVVVLLVVVLLVEVVLLVVVLLLVLLLVVVVLLLLIVLFKVKKIFLKLVFLFNALYLNSSVWIVNVKFQRMRLQQQSTLRLCFTCRHPFQQCVSMSSCFICYFYVRRVYLNSIFVTLPTSIFLVNCKGFDKCY